MEESSVINNIRDMITHDWPTTIVAVGGITSPAWLPYLETVSSVAALMLPILGAILLVIQIYSWLIKGHD